MKHSYFEWFMRIGGHVMVIVIAVHFAHFMAGRLDIRPITVLAIMIAGELTYTALHSIEKSFKGQQPPLCHITIKATTHPAVDENSDRTGGFV